MGVSLLTLPGRIAGWKYETPCSWAVSEDDARRTVNFSVPSQQDVELVQFMGKDNVPFHTIVFPAILMGTGGNWTKMRSISVTEYLNYEGVQFSKSRGTGGAIFLILLSLHSGDLQRNPFSAVPHTLRKPQGQALRKHAV